MIATVPLNVITNIMQWLEITSSLHQGDFKLLAYTIRLKGTCLGGVYYYTIILTMIRLMAMASIHAQSAFRISFLSVRQVDYRVM